MSTQDRHDGDDPHRAVHVAADETRGASRAAKPSEAFKIDFSTFILSIATAALASMGIETTPDGERPPVDLEMARHNIDILDMLEAKTRGNLTPEERNLLAKVLYDLRLNYVRVRNERGGGGGGGGGGSAGKRGG